MSLQDCLIRAFKKHVLDPAKKRGSWHVLVVDDWATKVLSHVLTMRDLTEQNITLVTPLKRARKELKMPAIYLMRPNWQEVRLLFDDFSSTVPKYTSAHVFFLLPCPDEIVRAMSSSNCLRYFQTISELLVDFLIVEPSVFSLNCRDSWHCHFLPDNYVPERMEQLNLIAEQLTCVCATLGERPKICYRKTKYNLELARLFQEKLEAASNDNPQMGQGAHKENSVVLILDRSFDPATPLLHDLTLQPMVRDLLKIEDNTYTCHDNRKIDLKDLGELWKSTRNMHIADVISIIAERIREFSEQNKDMLDLQKQKGGKPSEGASAHELSLLIKKLSQHNNEASSLCNIQDVASGCMNVFNMGYSNVCIVEQDMVMGETAEGSTVQDPMRAVIELFKLDFPTAEDRLRVLLLFTLIKDGVSETHLLKLLETAQVDIQKRFLFAALSLLCGVQLITPDTLADPRCQFGQLQWLKSMPSVASVSDKFKIFLPVKKKRKNNVDSNSYKFSRWTPYLRDIMESVIAGQLPSSDFAYLMSGNTTSRPRAAEPTATLPIPTGGDVKRPSARFHASASARTGSSSSAQSLGGNRRPPLSDHNLDNGGEHCGPRLIVFIVGGLSWSEVSTAHQITHKCIETRMAASDRHGGGEKNASLLSGGGGVGWHWSVVVGGTHTITPALFLDDLERMSTVMLSGPTPSTKEMPGIQGHVNPAFQRK